MEKREKQQLSKTGQRISRAKTAKKAWRFFRPLLVFAISLGICGCVFTFAYKFIDKKMIQPVDINDATPVVVTIGNGSGASSIAKKLYEAGGVDENGNLVAPGLISSKTVFKIYVDFTGKSSKLKAGTYVLSRNMDVAQIVDVICEGNPPRSTLKLRITEGMTCEQIAHKLVELGVLKKADEFLSLCKTGENFVEKYPFVANIPKNEEQARDYALEGYLFPDTYEIYSDEAAESVIGRLLNRFAQIMSDELKLRAEELNMSVDDVVTLASLVEKEARIKEDFGKVAAVFTNRLAADMRLQSDAPLQYILHTEGVLKYTDEQLKNPSLYNTHVHRGLPLGPIANPGKQAIEAVLFPNEEYVEEGYLYFCLKDNQTRELVFAKTLEEHQENVELYSPNW